MFELDDYYKGHIFAIEELHSAFWVSALWSTNYVVPLHKIYKICQLHKILYDWYIIFV